jgi:glycosyltransferase involved in cell wall biosynthesis
MKIHVQLFYGNDAEIEQKRFAAGNAPNRVPYGFNHAEGLVKYITYSSDKRYGAAGILLRRAIIKIIGFDFLHAFHNREKIFASDVIWTISEGECFAVAALLVLFLKRHQKIIGNGIFLFNRFGKMFFIRRLLLSKLMQRISILTVHSSASLDIARRHFTGQKIELMYFGISTDAFPITEPSSHEPIHRPIRILSLGTDSNRDWDCLLSAFGNDDRFELRVVCNGLPDSMLDKYRCLRFSRSPTIQEARASYLWADFVVITMVPNEYAGITVALEAAAMGTCVVSARTGGVPTYLDPLAALYYEPGKGDEAKAAIRNCGDEQRLKLAENAQRIFLQRGYSSKDFVLRYVALTEKICPQ